MLNPTEQLLVRIILAAFPLNAAPEPAPAIPDAQWDALSSAALRHGLGPLLYAALKKLDYSSRLAPHAHQQLQDSYRRSDIGNWMAFRELGRVLDLFERAKIQTILLKGAALALDYYPEPALRPLGDLDLLIPQSEVARARELLSGEGYAAGPEMQAEFEQRYSGEISFARRGKNPAQIDLHWHLFVVAYYRERMPVEWFWERTEKIKSGERSVSIFNPDAQLIYLCAHYALHHRSDRLLWLYDLALLLQRGNFDWEQVIEAVNSFGLTLAVRSTLAKVDNAWGIAPPALVTSRLESLRPDNAEKMVYQITTSSHPNVRVLLDGLSIRGWQARSEFWLRHLFPTPSYMRERYKLHNAWQLPLYYGLRVTDGAYRVARSTLSGFKVR